MAQGKFSGGSSKDSSKARSNTPRRTAPRPQLNEKQPKPANRPAPASAVRPRVPTMQQRIAARQRLRQRAARGFRPIAPPVRPGVRPIVAAGAAAAVTAAATAAAPTAATTATTATSAAAMERNQLQMQFDNVRWRFSSLEASAQLSDVYQAIGHLDSRLTQLPLELNELRSRGYVHAGQFEDKIAAVDEQWDQVRSQVEAALREQVTRLNQELRQVSLQVTRMAAGNRASISAADTAVNGLSQRINAAGNAVRGLYGQMAGEIDAIDGNMDQLDAMLDRFEASKIEMRETEAPLAAAAAEWHQNNEEGPTGFLFLTDQRLLFEQNEEVTTKKLLGLFATETEKIQELLLEIEIAHIDAIEDLEEKSGFLSMGKDEILELVMSAAAPVSRARFHLIEEDSTAWAALIKRVKSGDIDDDRAEEYIDEAAEADAAALTFPTQCPQCFAPVPQPPRGVTSISCDYCGSVIVAVAPEAAGS